MKHILLLTAALASLPLMAVDALDAYRKEVKPFLEEKKLDAYGKMRHLLINRFQSQLEGSFYNNVPELREPARREVEEMLSLIHI